MKEQCVRTLASITATFLVIMSAVAADQSLPAGTRMHRVEAGALDAHGWTVAVSSAGNFSVRLPCRFNDFTTQEQDPAARVLKADTVACLRSDQGKFLATRIVYRQGKQAAEETFNKIQRDSELGNPGKVTLSTFKGFKSIIIEEGDMGRCGLFRYVLVEADIVALIVDARRSCAEVRESADQFFSSLEILAPAKKL
jgi:hypothetical protein